MKPNDYLISLRFPHILSDSKSARRNTIHIPQSSDEDIPKFEKNHQYSKKEYEQLKQLLFWKEKEAAKRVNAMGHVLWHKWSMTVL